MPAGLDTVAMQEDVSIEERDGAHWAHIPPGLKAGANRRLAGEDTKAGESLVATGTRLRPQEVASAAATGLGAVRATHRSRSRCSRPATRFCALEKSFSEGKVYDANAPMLHGLIAATGAEASRHGNPAGYCRGRHRCPLGSEPRFPRHSRFWRCQPRPRGPCRPQHRCARQAASLADRDQAWAGR